MSRNLNTWDVASERRVAVIIRYLVNARSLKLECAMVLNESLLVPVLKYGGEERYGGSRRCLG